MRRQLEDSLGTSDRLHADIARLSSEVTRLTEEYRAAVEDREKFFQENNKLRDEIAQAIHETTGVSGARTELVEVHERLLAEYERQRDEISLMREELARVNGEKTSLIEEQKTLTDALSEQRLLRESLQEEQGEHRSALAGQGEIAEAMQRQLEDSQRDLAEAGELITRLEANLSDKEQEVSQSTTKINDLEQLLLTQSSQLASAVAALEKVEERLRAQDNEVEPRATSEELTAPLAVLSVEQEGGVYGGTTQDELSSPKSISATFAQRPGSTTESSETETGSRQVEGSVTIGSGEAGENAVAARPSIAPAIAPVIAHEKPQATSFIDRYAHIFEEEEAKEGCQAMVPSFADSSAHRGVQALESNAAHHADRPIHNDPHDDEESIEQYMAKLLQRVRGDSASTGSSQTSSAASAPQAADASSRKPSLLPQAVQMQKVGPDQESIQVPTPNLEEFMRKGPILEPSVDIEAFRALANESARHAIGVHATRKHRRAALSQMVVAILTGLTGLWLMWGAAKWLDVPFLSGCFILIVSAYFGGQTFRALWESVRAGKHHRNEEQKTNADERYHERLPIDVEHH